eukprot:TRINITY_DN730_c1_g1_i1.p1 TRINITY_DN730_c1_g1~~TRINITY_DN730_c1_g1_i1.p1  ORF type:complete len:1659 (+),score=506.48 TRINITY_DN730_c1_g1_i1:65-5041(+)
MATPSKPEGGARIMGTANRFAANASSSKSAFSRRTVPWCEATGLRFRFFTAEDARSLSVRRITEPNPFDGMGNPVQYGLYDPALGPLDPLSLCKTCKQPVRQCTGHFGHVELQEPLYNPLLFNTLLTLIRCSCLFCHTLRATEEVLKVNRAILKYTLAGDLVNAMTLQENADAMRTDSSDGGESRDIINKLVEGAEKCQPLDSKHIHVSVHYKQVVKNLIVRMGTAKTRPCPYCQRKTPAVKADHDHTKFFLEGSYKDVKKRSSTKGNHLEDADDKDEKDDGKSATKSGKRTFLTPSKLRVHLTALWKKDTLHTDVLNMMYGTDSPDAAAMFFVEVLLIPPVRFRPAMALADRMAEHPQTVYYTKIITATAELIKKADEAIVDEEEEDKLKNKKIDLMNRMELIVDMQTNYNSLVLTQDPQAPPSIRSMLEHKQGLFRMHMMGKRVNFAARSVISPDPYIDTNEIGVPFYFAMRLSYPEAVTHANFERLRQMVENGSEKYPGANALEDEFGNRIELNGTNEAAERRRLGEAKRLLTIAPDAPRRYKVVHRHIVDGDVVLVNRQPTLHKPSIMGHKVRVLSWEKTIRMHYANCSTYNADFDGDEMNIHVPQGPLARAEAMMIAFTDEQYVVPKDGSPLRGLIQDWIITGCLLTKRDTFFNKEWFQQLLFGCVYNVNPQHEVRTPPPAIMKPRMLWTGKQLVGAALNHLTIGMPSISMEGNTKIPGSVWGKGGVDPAKRVIRKSNFKDMTTVWPGANESIVFFNNNELLAGVLDKSQLGASNSGLIHSCYELYGSTTAGKLLSLLGRLLTKFLQTRGFTCGIDDLLMQPSVEESRTKLLNEANGKGTEVSARVTKKDSKDYTGMCDVLSEFRRDQAQAAMLDGKIKEEINQLTSKVIEQCIPGGQYKAFPANNLSLMTVSGARGSVVNFSQISCLLGQQELEGRRVPVMVSGKTLPSFPAYDTSARSGGFVMQRFLTGVLPQEYFFHSMAGREGLIDTAVKTSRSGYLQRCIIKMLEALRVHYDYTVRDSDGSVVQFNYGEDDIDVTKQGFVNKYKFWAQNFDALMTRFNTKAAAEKFSSKAINAVSKEIGVCVRNPVTHDPVMTKYFISENLGIVSEKFYNNLHDYIKADPDHFFGGAKPKIMPKKFEGLMYLKYHRSLVHPGEAVGVLAGQSIGEPSTQMTLNTFHLAGRGELNVTMGMPRLRELIMFAKTDIDTPSMTLRVKSNDEQDAQVLATRLSRLLLSDITNDIEVKESIVKNSRGTRSREYAISINLLPTARATLDAHDVTVTHFAQKFHELQVLLHKEIGKMLHTKAQLDMVVGVAKARSELTGEEESDDEDETTGKKTKGKGKAEDVLLGESDDENDEEDENAGADASRLRSKKSTHASYDDPEAEEVDQDEEEEEEEEVEVDQEEAPEAEAEEAEGGAVLSVPKEEVMTKELPPVTLTLQLGLHQKLPMLGLVEQAVGALVISECPGVKRCTVVKKTVKGVTDVAVQTEGVNLRYLPFIDHIVDINTIVCNDVASLLQVYGVEAARSSIVSEIGSVFKVYGINVDYRHLALIADYMTFEGGYRACNRTGIDSNPSPLLKMSFETTLQFLTKTTLQGVTDNLKTPAGCIVVGKPSPHGSGCFDLMQIMGEDAMDYHAGDQGRRPRQQRAE